jgi:hypothetical protein
MFVFITSILIFPFLLVLSILIFAVTFCKVGLQTVLGIFTKEGFIEIPKISLKILD